MYTQVFKEINREDMYTMYYFDTDSFSEKSGDYNNTLFILSDDYYGYTHHVQGINFEEWQNVYHELSLLANDFQYVEEHRKEYSYKKAMEENGIAYNPTKCSELKKLIRNMDDIDFCSYEEIAAYLTIKTGKTWKTLNVYGYCQGDMATVIYCTDNHTEENARIHGEIYIGSCTEFNFTYLNENGQEQEDTTVFGYFVADCRYRNDEELKKVLCEMEGIKPDETKLLLIDYNTMHTYTKYSYEYTEV